jgi:hypothetical protein
MRKLIFSAMIFGILFSNCTKHIEDFEYDDSSSLLTVVKWRISKNDRTAHYVFKEGPGTGRLIKYWLNTNMQVVSKTVNAKMGDIEQGDGFISIKINGTKYVYRLE